MNGDELNGEGRLLHEKLRECWRGKSGHDMRTWMTFKRNCLLSERLNKVKGKVTQQNECWKGEMKRLIHFALVDFVEDKLWYKQKI